MSPRTKRIAVIVPLALVVLVVAVFAGYRAWLSCSLAGDAPAIGMSADATVLNELGITSVTYETAVVRAGGRPRAVRAGDLVDVEEFLGTIDGLYLTGGGDVDPALWGGDPEGTLMVDPARDELELALIEGALDRGMPVLGICRGAQMINVALGGSLRAIRTDPELGRTHFVSLDSLSAHSVDIEPGTLLHRILDEETRHVNSFHGNAVDRLGRGLRVSARAPDGIVEAIEAADGSFVLGIQWHPDLRVLENRKALAIFEAFVEEAREFGEKRGGGPPLP